MNNTTVQIKAYTYTFIIFPIVNDFISCFYPPGEISLYALNLTHKYSEL